MTWNDQMVLCQQEWVLHHCGGKSHFHLMYEVDNLHSLWWKWKFQRRVKNLLMNLWGCCQWGTGVALPVGVWIECISMMTMLIGKYKLQKTFLANEISLYKFLCATNVILSLGNTLKHRKERKISTEQNLGLDWDWSLVELTLVYLIIYNL